MIDFIDRSVQFANRYRHVPVPGTTDIVDLIPAPGEVSEEGTLINKRAAQLLQADRRTYPALEPITAGDVLDVLEGGVGKNYRAIPNTKLLVKQGAVNGGDIISMTESLFVYVFYSVVDNALAYSLLTIKDGVLNHNGNSQIVGGAITNISLARLSDTKFVVGYWVSKVLYVKIGSVSGTTITFGDQYILSPASMGPNAIIPFDENTFFAVYTLTNVKATVFRVTGTAINSISQTIQLPGNTSASYISATRLPDLNGNKRVCICFSDGSDGNKGKAVIATIKADNTVEFGAVATFNTGATTSTACCTDGNDAIVSYVSSDGVYSKVLSVTEATINPNNTYEKLSTGVYTDAISLGNVGGKIIATVVQGAMVLKRSGNTLSKAPYYNFNSVLTYKTSLAPISSNQFILEYPDAANSSYGTATILEVHNDQIAGSFTDVSRDCIALADAAPGQPCEVIFDGVAELPGLTAGDEINSDGVYGYCPQDGRVWVRPEWDSTRVITGGYIGSGSSGINGPTKIDIGFRPSALMVYDASGIYNPYFMALSYPQTKSAVIQSSFENQTCTVEWTQIGVLFYSPGSSYQLNRTGNQYNFIAFK